MDGRFTVNSEDRLRAERDAALRAVDVLEARVNELEIELSERDERIEELRKLLETSLPADFDYSISAAVTRRDWSEVELVLHRYRVGFW